MARPALSVRAPWDVETLIDVALDLFTERGFDATSMADIAEAAGIRKSSIYHHVQNREDLLERALARGLDALSAVLDEAEALQAPAVDQLRLVIREAISVQSIYRREVALLLRLRGNSDVERVGLDARRAIDKRVERIIARAQKADAVRRDVAPALLARLMFGTVNSVIEWYQPSGRVRPAELGETVLSFVFNGMSDPRPQRRARKA